MAALAGGTTILTLLERRRQRRMAAAREPMTEGEFVATLVNAGAEQQTAEFVWRAAVRYYFAPLRPHPTDRWETTMRIDAGDLENISAQYWKARGWAEPTHEDPVVLPVDPTLQEYARWLDHQTNFKT